MNIEARGKEHTGKFDIGQYVSEKEQKPGCCGWVGFEEFNKFCLMQLVGCLKMVKRMQD